ncbi:MAG: glycosyltransferase family 39 protein [Burkholderiales bacterium]
MFWRLAIPTFFVAVFIALATVALDKPGYYYDEVIFVPVSLRVLGQCDVDAAVTSEIGCLPLMQTLGYVGALKAWLLAPAIAVFGANVWTIRLPPILVGAVVLLVLWSFARRELGGAWAILLLCLLAIDPVLLGHARLDWGPHMLAMLFRVLSLVALWRWLQTGRMHFLVLLCASLLLGFWDKLNFVWVVAAWSVAAGVVAGRLVVARLRDGKPWQPAIAGITVALLAWGVATLARRAARLDILGDAETLTLLGQLTKVWNLYAATFSGNSVLNWVFGTDLYVSSAFNVLALVQVATAALLLALWRPWTPARRLLAFLTVAMVALAAIIAATPQVGGTHHLIALWPLPTLHLVTLLAIVSQHAGEPDKRGGAAMHGMVAVVGAVACGVLFAWSVGMDLRYLDMWRNDRDFRPPFDSAVTKLGDRLKELDVDRVITVDWGLHQQLVTLAPRDRAARYREWTWRLIDAPDLEREDLRRAVAEHVEGKRVAFVLHGQGFTVFAGARERLDALLQRDRPCARTEETFVNASGRPLYTIIVADFRNCAAPAKSG